MITALIFEGGEAVSMNDNYLVQMPDWSQQSIERAFIDYFGEDWADEIAEDMLVDGPHRMIDLINVVNSNLAQAVTDGVDGGMTYLVRCPD